MVISGDDPQDFKLSRSFLILFGEFAVSDSIIVLVIQYSF
jgi:hypothetical protein